MKKLLMSCLVLCFAANVWAVDLNGAKTQGLVGERNDGYLGYVTSPSGEVKTLVQGVNNKRKLKFKQAAAKAGATVEQVAIRFAQRAAKKTTAGNYIQNTQGAWVKK